MIVWQEQTPDFCVQPLADLFADLPLASAVALRATSGEALRVVVPSVVIDGIFAHLRRQDVEMGGLLIGRVFDGSDRGTVAVDSFVESREFIGTGVSLTMGTAVWDSARTAQGPRQSVVGWYHSHPNLGVFFSGTDRRTQAAFFGHDHSLGLVVDPIRDEKMWFSGAKSLEVANKQVLIT